MPSIPISIVSDAICPWCYVGYSSLNRAITAVKQRYPEYSFPVSWQAFELHPEFPEAMPVMSKRKLYEQKFGNSPRFAMMQEYLQQRAAAVGAAIAPLNDKAVVGSTKLVHEAEVYAGEKGKQTELMLAFFDAYFTKSENIFEREKIVEIAKTVEGLDAAELDEYLKERKGARKVEQESAKNRYIGGVPHFTIGKDLEIHGGQEPAEFEKILVAAIEGK
ncbi:DSBA-like thioredoxin domain-containing protein [Myxozyma melibiosi]|uniref:DSBA-like thioredoxin domain-containing protein n=1 Tax=Myxozyma melibiosi TaxID=54550 RepID=A0ABR1FB62_9ASCO